MERNIKRKIILLILIIVFTVIAVILTIDGILGYKQHKLNQEHIHPNDVTTWVCKEINMEITYDNAAYNGELMLNGKNTSLSIEIIGTGDTMDFYKIEDYNKADDGDIKLFSGEFNFKNKKEFELKIINNNFLSDEINKLTFEKIFIDKQGRSIS